MHAILGQLPVHTHQHKPRSVSSGLQDLSPSETRAGGGPAASHAVHPVVSCPAPRDSEPPAELPEHCEGALEGPAGWSSFLERTRSAFPPPSILLSQMKRPPEARSALRIRRVTSARLPTATSARSPGPRLASWNFPSLWPPGGGFRGAERAALLQSMLSRFMGTFRIRQLHLSSPSWVALFGLGREQMGPQDSSPGQCDSS